MPSTCFSSVSASFSNGTRAPEIIRCCGSARPPAPAATPGPCSWVFQSSSPPTKDNRSYSGSGQRQGSGLGSGLDCSYDHHGSRIEVAYEGGVPCRQVEREYLRTLQSTEGVCRAVHLYESTEIVSGADKRRKSC